MPPPAPAPAPAPQVALTELSVDRSFIGGQTTRGVVSLSGAAPEGGVTVTLASDHVALVVPSRITIAAGMSHESFTVTSSRVTTTTDVTVRATVGEAVRTAPVRLRVDPQTLAPSATFSVQFSGFTSNRDSISRYTEAGFTFATADAAWMAITTYGNPEPSLQFESAGGATLVGELRITASDGSPFWHVSTDFYSSTTRIPYSMEGWLSGERMFTVADTLPNTFGNFMRSYNPHERVPVDLLVIRLTNPAFPCCRNPVGVDNIVLRR
jgi:hypothetical protein